MLISYLDNPGKTVIQLSHVRGKQKNTLLTNFTTQACVKEVFNHV